MRDDWSMSMARMSSWACPVFCWAIIRYIYFCIFFFVFFFFFARLSSKLTHQIDHLFILYFWISFFCIDSFFIYFFYFVVVVVTATEPAEVMTKTSFLLTVSFWLIWLIWLAYVDQLMSDPTSHVHASNNNDGLFFLISIEHIFIYLIGVLCSVLVNSLTTSDTRRDWTH